MSQQRSIGEVLTAFNAVEQFLKSELNAEQHGGDVPFAKLLNDFYRRNRNRMSRGLYTRLEALRQVRNMLVHHQSFMDQPLASPTADAVAAMRGARDELLHPPKALSVLSPPKPVLVAPDGKLTETLTIMRENDFSQLPVYEGNTFKGLLTTNTVARWFASEFANAGGVIEDPTVAEVLAEQEETPVRHLRRDVSTVEVVAEFQTMQDQGRPLQAVIISDAGKETQAPLAIVVAADLPNLIDK